MDGLPRVYNFFACKKRLCIWRVVSFSRLGYQCNPARLGFRVLRTAERQEALPPPKYGAQYNLRQNSLSESPIKFQVYLEEKLRSQT